jgi:hypothetical protein
MVALEDSLMEGQDILLDLVQVSKHCPGQGSDTPVAWGSAMTVLGNHMKETSKLISNQGCVGLHSPPLAAHAPSSKGDGDGP